MLDWSTPDCFRLPGEDILEGHLLPEESLLLDVQVAGRKVLKVRQRPRGQRGVDAG